MIEWLCTERSMAFSTAFGGKQARRQRFQFPVNGVKSLFHSMYVCMYIWGFRARQHLRSVASVMNDDYEWWWPNYIRGPWGSKASWHLSYRWRKTPRKPHPGNLSRPGIEPEPAAWQALMLPPVPQQWTDTLSILYRVRHLRQATYITRRLLVTDKNLSKKSCLAWRGT